LLKVSDEHERLKLTRRVQKLEAAQLRVARILSLIDDQLVEPPGDRLSDALILL
jgi:hypothetical protein